MKTKDIKSWRKVNTVLTESMTEKELKEAVNKNGDIKAKLAVDLSTLINGNIDELNDDVSSDITGSICGLTDISYVVAGATTDNKVIIEVTGTVEFGIIEIEVE